MLRAAIFNNALTIFGGGEKSTYSIASALCGLGFEVDVLTFEPEPPTQQEIDDFFGPGHSGFRIRTVAAGVPPEGKQAVLEEELRSYALFVNHCFGNTVNNPCPLGIYLVMFPAQDPGPWLSTYHYYLCISKYTKAYTRLRWGRELRTEMIYPCAEPVPPAGPRQRAILSIGRFNWSGHTKNQGALADAFLECLPDLPEGWRLILAGKLNDSAENRRELETLQARVRRLPVTLEVNITDARKRELLATSSLYWHGTGSGRKEPQDAVRMEHYGIAVVEAMASGAIPLAYAHGGPREIIAPGKTGFLYRNIEELKSLTVCLACDPVMEASFRAAGLERAKLFGRPAFEASMARFIRGVVAA